MSKQVMVLMGGWSPEREISLISGQTICHSLECQGYKVTGFDLRRETLNEMLSQKPNLVFNALHGAFGEDGCVQGLLECYAIPYTHSGVLASSVGLNKVLTRILVQHHGVPVPDGVVLEKGMFLDELPIPLPFVIKPYNGGSSIGVEIIRSEEDWNRCYGEFNEASALLLEAYIPGLELTCAVIDGKAKGLLEIIPVKHGWYDYSSKYDDGGSKHVIPEALPKPVEERIKAISERVHACLGCRGLTRCDFRYDDRYGEEGVYFLEINTQPGMTEKSLAPEILANAGITYDALVDWMVRDASVVR